MCERTRGQRNTDLEGRTNPSQEGERFNTGPGYSSSSVTFAVWIFRSHRMCSTSSISREVKAKVPRRVAFSSHAHGAAVKHEACFEINRSSRKKCVTFCI